MKTNRQPLQHQRRDAWLEINLNALEHNALCLRQHIPAHKAMMAVLKADAYGHGASMILPSLLASGVTWVGVASLDEALQLRQEAENLPILILGRIPDWALAEALKNNITLNVFDISQLKSLESISKQYQQPFQVHIKVDTGMHRIGCHWTAAIDFISFCQAQPYLKVDGVFTHLADAIDDEQRELQYMRWQHVLAGLEKRPPWCHIANSAAGILNVAQRDNTENMIRLGLGLFGYNPTCRDLPLKPAMSLKARIIHLQQHVRAGEWISYGHSYQVTQDDRTIATLPLGYADGISRGLSNQIYGMIGASRLPQVGNITMDQMMLDVTDFPNACLGDTVTLIGTVPHATMEPTQAIWLTDWANKLNTIEYELMCALRVRLPRTYTRNLL